MKNEQNHTKYEYPLKCHSEEVNQCFFLRLRSFSNRKMKADDVNHKKQKLITNQVKYLIKNFQEKAHSISFLSLFRFCKVIKQEFPERLKNRKIG